MSIPAAAKPTPIPRIETSTRLVDPKTGVPDLQGLRRFEPLRAYVTGMGRIIPCSCVSDSNVLTLSPNDEAPLIEGYRFGDIYLFVADASATGNVTATLVPKTGSLSVLKVYINGGASQAGNGDITADRVYMGVYHYGLDANAGGIVIRHP
jgi:hypothetical protein